MSGAAWKAVPRIVRFASMPAAVGTPKGLRLSSRGQGHAFCARRPRVASEAQSGKRKSKGHWAKVKAGCVWRLRRRGRLLRG